MPAARPARSRRRDRAIRRIAARLASGGWPRGEMALLVSLTGVAGLLASFVLLALGIDTMAVRYPAALLVAYGVFLLLIGAWLRDRRQRRDWLDPSDGVDAGIPDASPSSGWRPAWEGEGGGFGGGGASGSFGDEAAPDVGLDATDAPSAAASLGDAVDLDEALVFLVPLALAALGAFGALWVVWTAPVLFAELLLDAALAAGLYRRLRSAEAGGHWLPVAVKRTWLPALGLAIVLASAGLAMEHRVPGARSVGEFARGL